MRLFLASDLVHERADDRTGRWGKSTASLRLKWPQGIPSYFAASEDDVRYLLALPRDPSRAY